MISAGCWSRDLPGGGKPSFQERGVQQKSPLLELTDDLYLLNGLFGSS